MKFALSVVAAALTFNTSVSANTADDPERITIEGQYLSINESNSVKTPTPIIDVPQSLSIMTAEEITERGITSIGEIIADAMDQVGKDGTITVEEARRTRGSCQGVANETARGGRHVRPAHA